MTDESQDQETPDAIPHRNITRMVVRIGVSLSLAALVASAVYLAVITVKWRHHVQELADARAELVALVSSHQQALGAASSRLDSVDEGLHSRINVIIATVNDKAQAQDLDYLFRDHALAMADCVAETQQATIYVADARYHPLGVPYQRAVGEYCDEIETDLRDLTASPEEDGV